MSLARNLCKFGGGGKKIINHPTTSYLFQVKMLLYFHYPPLLTLEAFPDLKLDCKDSIHNSIVLTIFLFLPSYIQPYFLDLFCALKNNFRNKM